MHAYVKLENEKRRTKSKTLDLYWKKIDER